MIFLRFPNLLLVPLGLLCMPGYSQQEDFCIHPKEVTLTWSSGSPTSTDALEEAPNQDHLKGFGSPTEASVQCGYY